MRKRLVGCGNGASPQMEDRRFYSKGNPVTQPTPLLIALDIGTEGHCAAPLMGGGSDLGPLKQLTSHEPR